MKKTLQFRVGDLFTETMMEISDLRSSASITERERRLMAKMVYQLSKAVRAEIRAEVVEERIACQQPLAQT